MEKDLQEKLKIINEIRLLYPSLKDFYNKQNIITSFNLMRLIFYGKTYYHVSLEKLIKLKEIAEREYKND